MVEVKPFMYLLLGVVVKEVLVDEEWIGAALGNVQSRSWSSVAWSGGRSTSMLRREREV